MPTQRSPSNIVTVNLPKYNDNILTLIKPIAVQAEQYVTIHHKDAVLLEESNRKMNIFIENLGKSPKKKEILMMMILNMDTDLLIS